MQKMWRAPYLFSRMLLQLLLHLIACCKKKTLSIHLRIYFYSLKWYQDYLFWSCCSDFIFFAGPLETKVGENIPLPERDLFWTVRSIVGEFDHHGLGFPLQKLILGKLQFVLCFEVLIKFYVSPSLLVVRCIFQITISDTE